MRQEAGHGFWVGCFVVAVLFCLPAFAAAQTSSAPTNPGKKALLIGISKYENLPSLPGATNDVQLARQVLVSRFGFPSDQITVLTNEAATREGILAALRHFVRQTAPSDVVYIHYSGHGSQVTDLDGDEREDRLDETIVPQDGRSPNIPDITDDELEGILSGLRARTAVVVLDSCHSGTATRDVQVRIRAVPADTRLSLYQRSRRRTRSIVPLLSERYVLFTGAAAHEQALDGPVGDRYHGFFSYALFQSLRTAPITASPQEIYQGIKRELKKIQAEFGRRSMPEPQLEAPQARLVSSLFGIDSSSPSPPGQSQATWSSADGLARIVSRSLPSAEFLALDNPSSRIRLEVGVMQPRRRGIAVGGGLDNPVFRIRRTGEPRTLTNSLQLQIRTDCDCYLTIVDVDATGQVNLLFPMAHQRDDYYPHGFIHGGRTVLIPDALAADNRAGFHWDFTYPPGTDTIRVFASTDLDTAETIRRYARGQVSSPHVATSGGATKHVSSVSTLTHLRRKLIGTVTRGRIPVPDQPYGPGTSTRIPTTRGQPAPDWTARSVTVVITE